MILIFMRIYLLIKYADYQILPIFTRIYHLSISKYICLVFGADVFVIEDSLMRVVLASSFSSPSMPRPR